MYIREIIKDRILVLDGAMGTVIQSLATTDGNNDHLVLTRPDLISSIHRRYLEAGADIIETDSFNAQRLSQKEYGLESQIRELNLAAARLARAEADRMTALTPGKPRFVAGSIGPTGKTASISPDVEDPAYRDVDFDLLESVYEEQMMALLEGGVDLFLIETIFDTINAKAALTAAAQSCAKAGREVPVMLSVSVADLSGRILSGQTIEAFLASVIPFKPFSIGMNCSFGAEKMLPMLESLAAIAPCYTSAHPNAGMPDALGKYDQDPATMARAVRPFVEKRLVNILGGCCGTTPEHIAAIAQVVEGACPREIPSEQTPWLSGIDAFWNRGMFINVGERCNVAGSRKFLRLIKEKNWREALEIAAAQVRDGAMVLDVNMDDAMLDARAEMKHFLNLMASDPEISRVPVMVDSSRFEVLETALKCLQGKSIVNSLSLKEGEEVFLKRAAKVKELGAALIVMAFDEQGQADTYSRRIEICERAYRLLTQRLDFNPDDIIFDPNVLAVATGMHEHDAYALDFINATAWIKRNLPGAKVSGGLSNLSFAFRGNNWIREAMHAVFLYHAIAAGMDMAIVNPSSSVQYGDIPEELREKIEDVILNRRPDASERLVEAAGQMQKIEKPEEKPLEDRSVVPLKDRLVMALRKGDETFLQADLDEALKVYASAQEIIQGPLMEGMTAVGDLFAKGQMFLPQVVKTARTMKRAVDILKPFIGNADSTVPPVGKYLLATVKGDVHDIGKNIVGVVLACNNFKVIDLGVMTPAERIVEVAQAENVDFIGLSGLITPSLEEMCNVATKLREAGISKPLFVGGATTSDVHTAVKIAPLYDGPVFHVRDAAQNPVLASRLMTDEREAMIAQLRESQELIRREYAARTASELSGRVTENAASSEGQSKTLAPATASKLKIAPQPRPPYLGIKTLDDIPVEAIIPYINWIAFRNLWKVKEGSSEEEAVRRDAEAMLKTFKGKYRMRAQVAFYNARPEGDSIVFEHPSSCPCCAGETRTVLPAKRQSEPCADGRRLSLADFLAPEGDYVGVFALTVCPEFVSDLQVVKEQGDDYQSIMMQGLGDRLAEAASEYLHEKVRKQIWAYSPEENLSLQQMLSARYQGIRPAVGYPSLPDIRLMFTVQRLLDLPKLGISLTENGAMFPQASVCGLYIASPQSRYFIA
ncbi:MAG: methionine synthase [Candidatus Cryptobacteroides sp.]|nr:methionine synthase [Candidatus Cryptobacteroides sp.]